MKIKLISSDIPFAVDDHHITSDSSTSYTYTPRGSYPHIGSRRQGGLAPSPRCERDGQEGTG
jgi:hypothetical protein